MLDRKTPPPFVKSTSLHFPIPGERVLSNGISVHSISTDQDVVKIEATTRAGKYFEGKPELSHFTSQMLEKGAGSKSSDEIAGIFEQHGASVEIASGADFVNASLYCLSGQLKNIFPLFIELLTLPTFPEKELTLMKGIFRQNLKINNEKTAYLASKFLREAVFGSDHPYGRYVDDDHIASLKREELQSFFDARFKFDRVFVVGKSHDLDYVSEGLNRIASAKAEEVAIPLVEMHPSKRYVEKVSSVQSSIRFGKRMIPRTHADFYSLLFVNHYFGGFFGSQLMKNLREEKGLTYGISSSVNPFAHDSLLTIGTDVNKENKELAVREIMNEVKKINSGQFEEGDLELARRHFIGSVQSDFSNPFSIMDKIKNIILHELPATYYQAMLDEVDDLSLDDLKNIASRYFQEDSFHQVVVG